VVAAVIKHADNIAKNVANTSAIIWTSFVYAVFLLGCLGPCTLFGVALVVSAIILYAGLCTRESVALVRQAVAAPASVGAPISARATNIGAAAM
jgi:hypothetical protein